MLNQNEQQTLAAILASVQTDPGQRGLTTDPTDHLFAATKGQFAAACESLATHPAPQVLIVTGFWIPSASPPAFETDGPLGTAFLLDVFARLNIAAEVLCEPGLRAAFKNAASVRSLQSIPTHIIAVERPGPAADGSFRTMRGHDITTVHCELHAEYLQLREMSRAYTIGIGDGGNEIGMGNILPSTMCKNIPNAEQIHCVVPVDSLIVSGVSNWGAYALAAGVALLRGQARAAVSFWNDQAELERLREMITGVPLVDGVVGLIQPTVDGLSWADYALPIHLQREILAR